MTKNRKIRQTPIIEFSLDLHESKGGIEIRAEAHPSGEVRHLLSTGDVTVLEQIRLDAGSLITNFGTQDQLKGLGRRLFSTVFQGELRDFFAAVRASARNRKERLLLLIKVDPDSQLFSIPWELLHDDNCFLAKDTQSAVVRYFDQPLPVSQIAVPPPLRVLLTSANPNDLDTIEVAKEEAAIRRAYERAGRNVDLVAERHISIEKLEQIWRQSAMPGEQFHVWHHCGHGSELDSGQQAEFILYLESEGMKQPIEIDRLMEVVSFCPDLRVAIINVCRGSSKIGLAPALARINVPVVIGFQHSVYDTAALQFAEALHEFLLHVPIEFAVSLARKSMKASDPSILDWAQALVLSRRKDRGLLIRDVSHRSGSVPRQARSRIRVGTLETGTMRLPRDLDTELDAVVSELTEWE